MKILTKLRYLLLPRSLFGRSLMIIAMPVLLLQMIVAFVFFDRHWDQMSQKLVYALVGEVGMITDQIRASTSTAENGRILQLAQKNTGLRITMGKLDTSVLKSEDLFQKVYLFSLNKKLKSNLQQRLNSPFAVRSHAEDNWFEIVVQLDSKRMLTFAASEKRLTSATTYIFILWLIGSALILFGIAILFMRNQIRPIMRLAIAAEKFGKGQDVPDFKPVGASEVRQAAQAFLEMKERLKRQIEQRTAMLSGVSHDLRTPLTRMKLQLAMQKDSPGLADLKQDIDEMEMMIEGYLTFAKGEGDEAVESTDLNPIIDRIAAQARRQDARIELNLPYSLPLRTRPRAMERAISNVILNACKYAPQVWVSAYAQGGNVEIVVDDNGPGIAPELREEVFRPFYRVEKSRNKKTGGSGLGLAIARDIVHAHGGEIFMEDSNRGGLRVVIRLPL